MIGQVYYRCKRLPTTDKRVEQVLQMMTIIKEDDRFISVDGIDYNGKRVTKTFNKSYFESLLKNYRKAGETHDYTKK